jgi:hypothetical protein
MPWLWLYHFKYSRTSISGTASSGRKPVSGRISVRSDSFHRQNEQRFAVSSRKRELYACIFSPAHRSSTVIRFLKKSYLTALVTTISANPTPMFCFPHCRATWLHRNTCMFATSSSHRMVFSVHGHMLDPGIEKWGWGLGVGVFFKYWTATRANAICD